MAAGVTIKHKRKTSAFSNGELAAGEWGLNTASNIWHYSSDGATTVTIDTLYHKVGGTDVPIADGGTGASSASAARTALGLAIGSDVQAYSAAVLFRNKSLTVETPTASENIAFFYTDREITITRVNDVLKGTGSPSLTWNIHFDSTRDDGTPTKLWTANRATTSVSGATTTTFDNATIPAGSYVWFITSAVAGSVTEFHLTLTFTQG